MIDILMTTYNGECHLKNQLYSLMQQTEECWQLWIRDDGSTDNTIAIIRDFAKRDHRIHFVEDQLGNLGPGKSFLSLTAYAKAQYVTFCDQDDIWFERKLELLLKTATMRLTPEKPGLVYCDGYGYSDEQGIITLDSISRAHANNLHEFLFFNAGYQGCSMFFNQALCTLAKEYKADYYHMHDDVVSLLAHTFGDVIFLDKALMLYRQHSRNVTGNIQFGWRGLVRRVLNRKGFVISKTHYLEKKAFYNAYLEALLPEQQALFKAYLSYPNVNLLRRFILLIRYRFKEGQSFGYLWVKTLLRKPIQ